MRFLRCLLPLPPSLTGASKPVQNLDTYEVAVALGHAMMMLRRAEEGFREMGSECRAQAMREAWKLVEPLAIVPGDWATSEKQLHLGE